jgi:hypothetical protein
LSFHYKKGGEDVKKFDFRKKRKKKERRRRTNCKELGVGQNLIEFVKISIPRSFIYFKKK